ncbi:unnamed protein product [Phytophthora lilii]|uniref:Unnamed protein product n=1 Tax=Phytophthora lilii TaxID=2077276 RepID=A0A9W7DCT2_9STRA|nr:unnamed protein product [Phytophthora lilii]
MVSDTLSPTSPVSVLKINSVTEAPTTFQFWELAMREESRRDQQRRRMVMWRKQKKEKVADMNQERLRLEKELQLRLVEARTKYDFVATQPGLNAFRHAIIQCAALKSENLELQQAIERYTKFQSCVQREGHNAAPHVISDVIPGLEKTPAQDHGKGGWRVFFPSGEPSFYFSPFSKREFHDALHSVDVEYAEHHPFSATVGKILGWTVHYAPLARNKESAFVAHAQFSRRVRCPLDQSEKIIPRIDKKLWPVLVTPRSWGRVQTGDVCCQVLQSFDENSHVMVVNIPGEVNLRYVVLAQHTRERRLDGKRVDKYIMTIADSPSNSRNRVAEGPRADVHWVLTGGMCMSAVEVDAFSIDVVVDQWAEGLSERHGRELYVDWIRFPVRMEQFVSPVRLLSR